MKAKGMLAIQLLEFLYKNKKKGVNQWAPLSPWNQERPISKKVEFIHTWVLDFVIANFELFITIASNDVWHSILEFEVQNGLFEFFALKTHHTILYIITCKFQNLN